MLLDDLYQVIEKLRERMEIHQDKLKQSEALTRNALVDPLLRALGWDTEDPALAMPEYKLGSGFADYALLNGGKPAIVIEAKKLGTLLYSAAEQSVTYCVNDGIEYFVATDGRKWDVYETHRRVPLAEKKIVSFDITDSPASVCLDALALWRRSVQNGSVRKAQEPVLEQKAIGLIVEGNWIPLSKFQPEKGDPPPMAIRFPDQSTTEIKHWADIPQFTADWLNRQGKLNETCIPIQSGKRYILSGSPIHPNGADFIATRKAGQFYLEGNYSSSYHVKNATIIIEKAGREVRPAQFSVLLPQ